MTGDESYHAHCFTCRTCKRRIEELVFAKTSQGIYCMVSFDQFVKHDSNGPVVSQRARGSEPSTCRGEATTRRAQRAREGRGRGASPRARGRRHADEHDVDIIKPAHHGGLKCQWEQHGVARFTSIPRCHVSAQHLLFVRG